MLRMRDIASYSNFLPWQFRASMIVLRLARNLTTLVGLIAFGSPDSFIIDPRVFEREFKATYHNFSTVTNPATVTKSMGLLALAPLSWFLHRHRDNFIIPWQILLTYRDSLIWTTLSWQPNPANLSGLCKNACQPRHRRQLILTSGPLGGIAPAAATGLRLRIYLDNYISSFLLYLDSLLIIFLLDMTIFSHLSGLWHLVTIFAYQTGLPPGHKNLTTMTSGKPPILLICRDFNCYAT